MKQGKTIILLHGWGRAKNAQIAYHKVVEVLKKYGFTVYVPDMPGFGETPIPTRPFMLQDYSNFLTAFIKTHAIVSPILIGHSFGGRVALQYASQKDVDVKSIILSGTPGYLPVKRIKWIISMIISKIGGVIFLLPGLSKIRDQVRARYYYFIGARDFYRAQGTMRQTFKNVVGESLQTYMERIRIPTLLIWGSDDVIVPIAIAKQMEKTIAHAKLICIPHAGHSVIIDEPKQFVAAVISFLNTI